VPATLILFETAPRLAAALADLAAVLGDRPAAVARELTKAFEELRRGPLPALARHYAEAPQPKGEIVLVIGPPPAPAAPEADAVDALLRRALASSSVKDAAAAVAQATGLARRDLYARALALTGGEGR
jgi:16S rRNA (cytidine1402-2'-O)-methyltransferase